MLKVGGPAVSLSRLVPIFSPVAPGDRPRALDHRSLSRKPVYLSRTEHGVQIDAGGTKTRLAVDGREIRGLVEVEPGALADGVVLELGQRIVLMLRETRVPERGGIETLGLVGSSAELENVRTEVLRVARLAVPVLIRGETGTGKERVAAAIHEVSSRRRKPMVCVNMASLPTAVATAELFGHRKGAFTGAVADRAGWFEEADGGTLFLDEIGDASREVQALLLRALETGEVVPVGAGRPEQVDVRVVAATDADLERSVETGGFRAPLLHRLAGYQITIPPLRARRDDIGPLFAHFLKLELQATGETECLQPDRGLRVHAELMTRLLRHSWPGNARQLRNAVRTLLVRGRDATSSEIVMVEDHLDVEDASPEEPKRSVAPSGVRARPSDVSDDTLLEALEAHEWKIGPTARALGLKRSSLYYRIDHSERIRKASDIPNDELLEVAARHDNDVRAIASASPNWIDQRRQASTRPDTFDSGTGPTARLSIAASRLSASRKTCPGGTFLAGESRVGTQRASSWAFVGAIDCTGTSRSPCRSTWIRQRHRGLTPPRQTSRSVRTRISVEALST